MRSIRPGGRLRRPPAPGRLRPLRRRRVGPAVVPRRAHAAGRAALPARGQRQPRRALDHVGGRQAAPQGPARRPAGLSPRLRLGTGRAQGRRGARAAPCRGCRGGRRSRASSRCGSTDRGGARSAAASSRRGRRTARGSPSPGGRGRPGARGGRAELRGAARRRRKRDRASERCKSSPRPPTARRASPPTAGCSSPARATTCARTSGAPSRSTAPATPSSWRVPRQPDRVYCAPQAVPDGIARDRGAAGRRGRDPRRADDAHGAGRDERARPLRVPAALHRPRGGLRVLLAARRQAPELVADAAGRAGWAARRATRRGSASGRRPGRRTAAASGGRPATRSPSRPR